MTQTNPMTTDQASIALTVNGERITCEPPLTLEALLAQQGYGTAKVATARNGTFVPAMRRALTALSDGDAIEIVAPRAGG